MKLVALLVAVALSGAAASSALAQAVPQNYQQIPGTPSPYTPSRSHYNQYRMDMGSVNRNVPTVSEKVREYRHALKGINRRIKSASSAEEKASLMQQKAIIESAIISLMQM